MISTARPAAASAVGRRLQIPWLLGQGGGGGFLIGPSNVQPVWASSYARKMRLLYSGFWLNIRRSSDNLTQDIGYVGAVPDFAAALTFVGASNGFVVREYNNMPGIAYTENTVAADQPQVIAGGVWLTTNGFRAVKGDGTDYLESADILGGSASEYMACLVGVPAGGANAYSLFHAAGNNASIYGPFTDNNYYMDWAGNRVATAGGVAVTGQKEVTTYLNTAAGAVRQIWRNGVQVASGVSATPTSSTFRVMQGSTDFHLERVIFNTAAGVAERDRVTRNQGAFFGVTIP